MLKVIEKRDGREAGDEPLLLDEIARACSCLEHLLEGQPGGTARGEVTRRQFRIAEDRRQEIIKIVGNTTGQRPNSLHLLGLAQLFFKKAALRNGTKDDHSTLYGAFPTANRGHTVRNRFFTALTRDQHDMIGQVKGLPLAQDIPHRTLHCPMRLLIAQPEHGIDMTSQGLRCRPAGQLFGHPVHKRNLAVSVGGSEPVGEIVGSVHL